MLPRLTVITGNGKGKTTAAMGRAALAAWTGEKVLVVQFLKGTGYTGELQSAGQWAGRFVIKQFGAGCLNSEEIRQGLGECRRCGSCFRANKLPENRFVEQAFEYAGQAVESGQYDLLVLDEVSHAINKGLLDLAEFVAWLQLATTRVRLVMTGRNMPPELIALADEATECEMVKHPIAQGIFGRWGVEY
jgi:cob(I)alamin adenosyltransferase